MTRTPRTSRTPELSRARSSAQGLLAELRIEAPHEIDVELIAANRGLAVLYKPLHHEEGRLIRARKVGIIVVHKRFERTEKARFVIAHELGHFVQHAAVDQFELCTNSDLNAWYRSSGTEPEANAFASELLMPSNLFLPRCNKLNKPNLHHVRELAADFNTSLTATAIRLVQSTEEPCAVVYSANAKIEWCVRNDSFCFTPLRGAGLTSSTYAGDIFAGKRVEDAPQLMDGAMWPGGVEIDVQEHSLSMPSYNAVLTLLWHAYTD